MINTKALRKRRIHTGIRVLINIVTAIIVLIPLLYAVSIAFMPSGELFTMDMNLFPKNPTIENFKQAFTSVPLLRFIINSFVMAACITLGQIVTVAFFLTSIMAAGLPTTRLLPITTAFLPVQSIP